jgi:hypothetical protein
MLDDSENGFVFSFAPLVPDQAASSLIKSVPPYLRTPCAFDAEIRTGSGAALHFSREIHAKFSSSAAFSHN